MDQMSASEKNSTSRAKREPPAAEDESTQKFYNMDELLARSKVSFKRVLKYYWQWVLLLLGHATLVFYLPIIGN